MNKVQQSIQGLIDRHLALEQEFYRVVGVLREATYEDPDKAEFCAMNALALSQPILEARTAIMRIGNAVVKSGLMEDATFDGMCKRASTAARVNQEKLLEGQRTAMSNLASRLEAGGNKAAADHLRGMADHPNLVVGVVKLPKLPSAAKASESETH